MTEYMERIGYLKDRLESSYVEETSNVDNLLRNLLNAKLSSNLDRIRDCAVTEQLQSKESATGPLIKFQEDFKDLEFRARSVQFETEKDLLSQYTRLVESLKTRRYSVDFDSAAVPGAADEDLDAVDLDQKDNEEETLGELRQRLLGKTKDGDSLNSEVHSSVEKQMQVQDNLQEQLVHDMSQLVSSLREGAEAFQNALQEDSTVLKATEIGLQVTSKSLSSLGTKLKKYHNSKFGFFFYIGCTLAMLLGLLITYLIIKIFPKM